MSISAVVDQEYRLHVDDLNNQTRQVVISNVSYQGIEELAPVLHFEGIAKRLVLEPDQVRALVLATNSSVFEDWIGTTVLLQPRRTGSAMAIEIVPLRRQWFTRRLTNQQRDPDRIGWLLAICLVLLLGLLSAYYVDANFAQLNALLEQLLP